VDKETKYGIIGLISLLSGIFTVFFYFDYPNDGAESSLTFGIASVIIMLSIVLYKRVIKRKYKKLVHWTNNSILGSIVGFYSVGFTITLVCSVYSILPIPRWILIVFGVLLAFVALVLIISIDNEEQA